MSKLIDLNKVKDRKRKEIEEIEFKELKALK